MRAQSIQIRLTSINIALLADILSILVIGVVAFIIGVTNRHIVYDDAFITYRYSYNLATGNGYVYNIGERFMGTTAPFYGILLGILAIPFPQAIPLISGILCGLSLILTGIALYLYGRIHNHALCGFLAGIFFVLNPFLQLTFGGEMLFQLMLIAWAFVFYALKRTQLSALLLAIAVLTRPDSVLALVVIGVHYLITRRRLPWREIAILAIVLIPFMIISALYYGSFIPGTLGAKLAQRDSGLWISFTQGMIEWIKGYTVQNSSPIFRLSAAPYALHFALFGAIGIPALLILFRFWLLPLSWVLLYTLGYHFLNVPFYHWYTVPIAFALMILAAAGVAGVVESLTRFFTYFSITLQPSRVMSILGIISILALSNDLYAQITYQQRIAALQPNPAERLYEKTGRWFAENTDPTASIGYFEIGYIGYYSHRTIIDPLGLVNEGLSKHIATRDFLWSYDHIRPDYIIHNQLIFVPFFSKMTDELWFKQEYREVAQISQEGYPPLIIYKRIK